MICLMFYKEFQCMTKFTTNLKKKLKKKEVLQIYKQLSDFIKEKIV